ncbi:hypothetical protein [Variovorax sp. Varisp36]|jgi:hypothetical protein|uniref:hypothetical protein n=1 Tax=Variovorax sp. Varisp36 TaxID=3243031 RepID=UPI0039A55C64
MRREEEPIRFFFDFAFLLVSSKNPEDLQADDHDQGYAAQPEDDAFHDQVSLKQAGLQIGRGAASPVREKANHARGRVPTRGATRSDQ